MRSNSKDYQNISDDDQETLTPLHFSTHEDVDTLEDNVSSSTSKHVRWDHIQNLDLFFTRVYQYHQRGGFFTVLLEEAFQLFQLAFVVCFSVFLMQCVKYDVLFRNTMLFGNKTRLSEAVLSADQCVAHLNGWVVLSAFIALVFWFVLLFRVIMNTRHNWAMRKFYTSALGITDAELHNMTWHEIQRKLLDAQKELLLSKQKADLTQLDVYNRILRFKNYTIAMVNKSVLPVRVNVPRIGEYIFLSNGLKFNLDLLLFWGPWAPFEHHWQLRAAYKRFNQRHELAQYLSSRVLIVGILNLILAPLIFLWQILHSFFKYAELLKREPGMLGSRRWSHYGRFYLRHFNELDHEFQARVSRAYQPATRYMNSFSSLIVIVMAKNVMFFAGALLATLAVLCFIDDDVLYVEHVLSSIATLGIVVTICRSIIPDENLVWCPEALLLKTLAHCHYMPDQWKHRAHTNIVRAQFAQLFQYKVTYLMEELLSPIITPLLLLFVYRHRTLEWVDFLRNFTIDVAGVGDVCSFAQMDVQTHGHPHWLPPSTEVASEVSQRAEHGKAELSLMHFQYTNPEWIPPQASAAYLQAVRAQASIDADCEVGSGVGGGGGSIQLPPLAHPSLSLMQSMYPLLSSSLLSTSSATNDPLFSHHMYTSLLRCTTPAAHRPSISLSGALSRLEGPTAAANATSLAAADIYQPYTSQIMEEGQLELLSIDMSASALYLHDLHHRRCAQLQNRLDMTPQLNYLRRNSNLEPIEQENDEVAEVDADAAQLSLIL